MSVNPQRVYAAAAVCSILRHGGRATVATVARELGLPKERALRSLGLAQREQLVFSRDRNVWTSTRKARELYAQGERSRAAAA